MLCGGDRQGVWIDRTAIAPNKRAGIVKTKKPPEIFSPGLFVKLSTRRPAAVCCNHGAVDETGFV